jgi:hypothetical protein
MRLIPSALQAKLDSGVTTLARAFIVRRRDGVVQGFTDHDEDIVVDGVTCRAATGLSASEATAELGLAVQGADVFGALAGDALSEADLAAGRYDAATIELYIVDWSEPALFVLLVRGAVGEVRREGAAFTAERRAGGASPRPARPISATRAARSTSTIRRSAARARSQASPARRCSTPQASTPSTMAPSPPASSRSPPAPMPGSRSRSRSIASMRAAF